MAGEKKATKSIPKESAQEADKFDIEDILEPQGNFEESELETGPAEEKDAEKRVETKVVEKRSGNSASGFFGRTKKSKKEVAQKSDVQNKVLAVEDEGAVSAKVIEKKGSPIKTFLAIFFTMVVTAAVVLAGVYFWLNRSSAVSEVRTDPEVPTVASEERPEKNVFVDSETGLNLRKEPLKTAEILVVIPNGTKLVVLEEKDEWYKTIYQEKEGWVVKEFTSSKNPLTYENKDYKFSLDFTASWSGFKAFKIQTDWADDIQAPTYYFALPTTDKTWPKEDGIDEGYRSLFAITVFTTDQWSSVKEDTMVPTKLEETAKYVFTVGYPNGGAPDDLTTQLKEAKEIVKTFTILK